MPGDGICVCEKRTGRSGQGENPGVCRSVRSGSVRGADGCEHRGGHGRELCRGKAGESRRAAGERRYDDCRRCGGARQPLRGSPAGSEPGGTAAVSSLDGRNREIFDGLRQGLAKAEIARRLGVGRTTLYLYLKKNEDAGLRTGTAGAGRAGAGKNGGSGAGAGRGVAAGTGREVAVGAGREVAAGTGRGVAAGADRGEIGLQANKAIYDRNRT